MTLSLQEYFPFPVGKSHLSSVFAEFLLTKSGQDEGGICKMREMAHFPTGLMSSDPGSPFPFPATFETVTAKRSPRRDNAAKPWPQTTRRHKNILSQCRLIKSPSFDQIILTSAIHYSPVHCGLEQRPIHAWSMESIAFSVHRRNEARLMEKLLPRPKVNVQRSCRSHNDCDTKREGDVRRP